ncbi:MAG: hypothetical protein JJV99_02910 [Colwellia sp.]|nr:hypothetical protein [Colwellia sp.]
MSHFFTSKILLSILLGLLTAPVTAHTYFFGLSELNLNSQNKHIEVIHQFTAHDIENAIAEIKQINFSTEHPKYDQYIQDYFEKHFTLKQKKQAVKLSWIGFEVKHGKIFVYQESTNKNYLANLVIKNTILVDTYTKQTNILNHQWINPASKIKVQGSLLFNNKQRIATIKTLSTPMNTSNRK